MSALCSIIILNACKKHQEGRRVAMVSDGEVRRFKAIAERRICEVMNRNEIKELIWIK